MRDIIKKILKEERDYHNMVFLIMSEDEKYVKYNIHVGGEKYFSGGPNEDGWETIDKLNDKTFQEFYVNQKANAEGLIRIIPQPQLDTYKPKVVEYIMGFFRRDDIPDVFDKLYESENEDLGELNWARDAIYSKEYDRRIPGDDMGDQIKSSVKKIVFLPSVKGNDYLLKDVINILKNRGFKLYTPHLPRRRSDLDILPNIIDNQNKQLTYLMLNNKEDNAVMWSALDINVTTLRDNGTYSAEEFVNNFKTPINESENNDFDWIKEPDLNNPQDLFELVEGVLKGTRYWIEASNDDHLEFEIWDKTGMYISETPHNFTIKNIYKELMSVMGPTSDFQKYKNVVDDYQHLYDTLEPILSLRNVK